MPDVDPFGLPFDEAIAFLRAKLPIPTQAWNDLWEHQHDTGFMVAKATSLSLLADFREALALAMEAGTTLADFRREFDGIVKTHGWTGWTGEGSEAGRAWRARVIYDTNLRTARAAGRWEQIERTKAGRPWLRYFATLDDRTRPDHRRWHGIILPVDHPFWQTHFPPNGWYCRCTIQQLSDRDLERRGWQPTAEPDMSPDGIDPGFAYAPGRSGQRQAVVSVLQRQEAAVQVAPPPPSPPTPDPWKEARDEMLREGTRTGHEWMRCYTEGGDDLGVTTSGKRSSVGFTAAMRVAIMTEDRRVVAHHNHPSNTSLSGADIECLGYYPGLVEIVAHGHQGSFYAARRGAAGGGMRGKKSRLSTAYKAASTNLQRRLSALLDLAGGPMAVEEAGVVHAHLVMLALEQASMVEYRYELRGAISTAMFKHRDLLASLVREVATALRRKR